MPVGCELASLGAKISEHRTLKWPNYGLPKKPKSGSMLTSQSLLLVNQSS